MALFDGFANPILFISALLRTLGNSFKLIKSLINIIGGGEFMETIKTVIYNTIKKTGVMETLLVVGNLGASIADYRLGTE